MCIFLYFLEEYIGGKNMEKDKGMGNKEMVKSFIDKIVEILPDDDDKTDEQKMEILTDFLTALDGVKLLIITYLVNNDIISTDLAIDVLDQANKKLKNEFKKQGN